MHRRRGDQWRHRLHDGRLRPRPEESRAPARPPSPVDPRPATRHGLQLGDHQLGARRHCGELLCHQHHRGPDRSHPVEQERQNVDRFLSGNPSVRRRGDPPRYRGDRIELLVGHRGLLVGHRGPRTGEQHLPDDRSNARLERLGRPFRRDESHEECRRLPSRMIPTRDVRLGSGKDLKLGGVASRQPIGPDGGQNPRTLPENEKRTPEGVLFL